MAKSIFNGERELIVIFKPQVGLRATGGEVAAENRPRVRMKRRGGEKNLRKFSEGTTRKAISDTRARSFNALLKSNKAALTPIFGAEDRLEIALSNLKGGKSHADISNMSSFYRVAADDKKLDKLAEEMLNLPDVDGAYVKPAVEPAIALSPAMQTNPFAPPPAPIVTPSYQSRQHYLEAGPGGIDAYFAWTKPGGKGQGVKIIDIEEAWQFSHEALLQNQGGLIGGEQYQHVDWRNHGTAVLGIISGDENKFGVTGICPEANVRAISNYGAGQNTAKSIRDAADALRPGDILLLELHAPGPRFNYEADGGTQNGFIAQEFWPADFAAIAYAAWKGIIVVEAAGNGAENLDDALYEKRPVGFPKSWRNPFNTANAQSGAIMVGAGAPPPGTHDVYYHGADRSRLGFSNYGSRVDVQGWGREVTSTGYGWMQGGTNEDQWYTDTFSGTSSASPIVVGALACLQGMLRAANKPLLTPKTARSILHQTGSPQQDEPGRPVSQRIGHRPDLKQAYNKLFASKPVVKDGKGSGKNDKEKGRGKGGAKIPRK